VIDRQGKVLSEEEVDLTKVELPVTIVLESSLPSPPRAGLGWPGVVLPNKIVSRSRFTLAADLATFLRERMSAEKEQKNTPRSAKIYTDHDNGGLLLKFDDRFHVFWGNDEDRGQSNEPSDLEKWRRITAKAWGQEAISARKADLYLGFTRNGVEFRPFGEK
jgi:hypothetical protein